MKPSSRVWGVLVGAVLLDLASVALAHGHDEDASMEMSSGMNVSEVARPHIFNSTEMGPPSYFRHPEYSGLMVAHIVLMSIAWIFVLPLGTLSHYFVVRQYVNVAIGVMLSIARSRLNLPVQFTFLFLNAFGLLFGAIYNNNTPDLYPNNAHHRIGWLLICITCAQTCMALLQAYIGRPEETCYVDERVAFTPISTHAIEEHRRIHNIGGGQDYRFSNDSGQGTERNTESLRSHSTSSDEEIDENRVSNVDLGYDTEHDTAENPGILQNNALDKFFMKKLPSLLSSKTLRALELVYEAINRVILILGFMALTTGIVTYGGIFVSYVRIMDIYGFTDYLIARVTDIFGSRPLHQRRRFLLVWNLHPWTLGGLLCRARLGKRNSPLITKLKLTLAGLEHKAIKKHWQQTQENDSVR
jgi:hypothetical protein